MIRIVVHATDMDHAYIRSYAARSPAGAPAARRTRCHVGYDAPDDLL